MEIKITKTDSNAIHDFRVLFLEENNFQFIYNKCHDYGWADSWLIELNGEKIGYGAVWGASKREDRDAIFEFYLLPEFRKHATLLFEEFISTCGATIIECQSNDPLLTSLLFEFAENINAESILFRDDHQTELSSPGSILRKEPDSTKGADVGGYYLEINGEPVATGGFMLNYNKPYADIYMDVKEPFRKKGFGSFLIQELKKEIYQMERVPAARCNINNRASKASLLKAGFTVCGAILNGKIKKLFT